MSYLIDTNVISELRKGARADANVRAWFDGVESERLYISVLVIGEIHRGIESIRRRDRASAVALDKWLARLIGEHVDRILDVTLEVVAAWARLDVPDPLPTVDGLLAATAQVHALTLVTRNVRDVERTGVPVVDPFAPPSRRAKVRPTPTKRRRAKH